MAKASVALAALALAGCASFLPTRSSPERGGIGISVTARPPVLLPIFTRASQRVYFVRVDGPGGLFGQGDLIPSNSSGGGWVYLLDAPPGRYAAIASVYTRHRTDYVTVFSRELIEATVVTLLPGAMAFMGEHLADATSNVRDGDAAQRHYFELIAPNARTGVTADLPLRVIFYAGSSLDARRDQASEVRFRNAAAGHLKGTDWTDLLEGPSREPRER